MVYKFDCQQGHEPETLTVEADNDEEAMEKMMEVSREHLAAKHADMPPMSDEDMKNMLTGGWRKEEAEAAV